MLKLLPEVDKLLVELGALVDGLLFALLNFLSDPHAHQDTEKDLTDEVFKKMLLPKHESMGYPLLEVEMLAIIMYTGTDCYADFRKTQQGRIEGIEGLDEKWKVFDDALNHAIVKLAKYDPNKPLRYLYHGLNGVDIDSIKKKIGDRTDEIFTTVIS